MKIYEAYIVIPKNVDRDSFVKNCLSNNECAIGTSNGIYRIARDATSLIDDNDGLINTLDFPKDHLSQGSKVIVIELPVFREPIVFLKGDINNRFKADEEKLMKLFKKSNENSALVELRGLKGILNVNTTSDKENGGVINIEAINKDENIDSIVNIKSDIVNNYAQAYNLALTKIFEIIVKDTSVKDDGMSLLYKLEEGFSFIDEWNNEIIQNEDSLDFKHGKKINLGSGDEPILLGDTTTQWLDDFLTDLDQIYSTLIVPTAVGPSGTPTNAPLLTAKIAAYKTKLDSLKSKYSNTE